MKKLDLFLFLLLFAFMQQPALAQVNGQLPIDPTTIPQFVDPLPHFAGQRVDASGGNLIIRYEPTQQIAVSTGTVLAQGVVGIANPEVGKGPYWGYSISNDGGDSFTPPMWPSFTIEAYRNEPVNVQYVNNLFEQTYAKVNLVADQTLHWADPLNEYLTEGYRPVEPYMGPIPVAPHLHGGEVTSESDGIPDAWFTPGLQHKGPAWYEGGADDHFHYPNTQEEATLWYHDHSLGVTRLNVYAGLAGFYFLRGPEEEAAKLPGWSGDDLVQEVAPPGTSGTFNPEPYLPEIEVVFQDRMFDTHGELYFPNLPSVQAIHPYWTPEFIGDIITVNGKTWPYLSVAPRKYRFRLLNGSNARFYEMFLNDLSNEVYGPPIVQVGTDGGLMNAPAVLDPNAGAKLLLAPGERADVVIDFSTSAPNQAWTLMNIARTPYPKGTPPMATTTGRLMQFVVNGIMVSADDNSQPGTDKSMLPASLRQKPLVELSDFAGGTKVVPNKVRQLTLNEVMAFDEPLEALLNNTNWDGNGMEDAGLEETELPVEGETELWQIINLTGDAHPIHLHLVQMQLVSRQKYNFNKYWKAYELAFDSKVFEPEAGPPNDYNELNEDGALGGNPAFSSYFQGPAQPPKSNERGWKDTYVMYPGEVTTFITRFAPTHLAANAPASDLMFDFDPSAGLGYVWHCHILDHEDNEMMRPYKVVASPYRTDGEFTAENLKSGSIDSGNLIGSYQGFSLDQNYPNPFTGDTEIRFNVPERMHTRLALINQNGQTVSILLEQMLPEGNHSVRLNASGLSKGIYLYRLTAGSYVATKRLVVN